MNPTMPKRPDCLHRVIVEFPEIANRGFPLMSFFLNSKFRCHWIGTNRSEKFARLEKSKDHAEFYEMFLNHSAVAKGHNLTSGEPIPRFDEAVKFFGDQMGCPTTDKSVKL
jgi:hypothetical protein